MRKVYKKAKTNHMVATLTKEWLKKFNMNYLKEAFYLDCVSIVYVSNSNKMYGTVVLNRKSFVN